MGALVMVLMAVGFLLLMIGGIVFLVKAFQVSVLWGLAVLFIPFASLVFLFKYWEEARKPFLAQLLGLILYMGAFGLAASRGVSPGLMSQIASQVSDADTKPKGGLAVGFDPAEPEPVQESPRVSVEEAEMKGKTLDEVKRMLGAPKGVLKADGRVTYFYDGLELVSEDGKTVSEVSVPIDEL